jgi:hypothetical protein
MLVRHNEDRPFATSLIDALDRVAPGDAVRVEVSNLLAADAAYDDTGSKPARTSRASASARRTRLGVASLRTACNPCRVETMTS